MLGGSGPTAAPSASLRPSAAFLSGVELAVTHVAEARQFFCGGLLLPQVGESGATTWFGGANDTPLVGTHVEARSRRGVNGAFLRLEYASSADLAIVLASVGVRNPGWLVEGLRIHGSETFLVSGCGGVRVEIGAPAPDTSSRRLDPDAFLAEHLSPAGRAAVTALATDGSASAPVCALTRVCVPVRDVRAAVSFFSDVLGFVQQQSRPDAVVVTNGAQAIDLLPVRKRVFGPTRLAFVVGDASRLAAIAAGATSSQNRPGSVRVAGPEGLAVTVCLDARLASEAVLREVLADA